MFQDPARENENLEIRNLKEQLERVTKERDDYKAEVDRLRSLIRNAMNAMNAMSSALNPNLPQDASNQVKESHN